MHPKHLENTTIHPRLCVRSPVNDPLEQTLEMDILAAQSIYLKQSKNKIEICIRNETSL